MLILWGHIATFENLLIIYDDSFSLHSNTFLSGSDQKPERVSPKRSIRISGQNLKLPSGIPLYANQIQFQLQLRLPSPVVSLWMVSQPVKRDHTPVSGLSSDVAVKAVWSLSSFYFDFVTSFVILSSGFIVSPIFIFGAEESTIFYVHCTQRVILFFEMDTASMGVTRFPVEHSWEFVNNSVSLNCNGIWIEIEYLKDFDWISKVFSILFLKYFDCILTGFRLDFGRILIWIG